MHKRSIRNSSFELRCNKSLRDMIGKYAAITAYMEISCQKMDEGTMGMDDKTKREYLEKESAKYNIQLNHLPEALQPSVKVKSYMALPWATLDSFFSQFANEVRLLVDPKFKINPQHDENKLEVAIRELKKLGCTPRLEKFKLDTYYYYNKIRNDYAHNLWDESSIKKETSLYESLKIDDIHKFFPTITDAPSSPKELKYADFTLFEAMIIHIADMLTVSIEDKIDWTLYYRQSLNNHQEKKKLKEANDKSWKRIRDDFPRLEKHSGSRKASYVRNCIKCLYGKMLTDQEIENMISPIE